MGFDCSAWFNKILRDLRDAQEPSGRVLTVAPSYPAGRFPGAFDWTVEWGAAAVLLTWQQYQWTGDPQVLRDNFEMMRRFTDYLQTEAKDGLAPAGLGDWYDYGYVTGIRQKRASVGWKGHKRAQRTWFYRLHAEATKMGIIVDDDWVNT
jgi:hypothetical protein